MGSSSLPDQSGSIPESGILTMGSLFAGIGGFELGFESTGRIKTEWQVEKDDYAQRVLAKHWPDVYRHDDVCTFPTPQAKPVDIITAGWPCQDISFAGKGAGLDGQRSGLFYEAIRIVRDLGPSYIVLENVRAILNRGIDRVLGTLADIGYDCEWHSIRAASVGAPHRRERVFIIAYCRGERLEGVREAGAKGEPTGRVGGESSRLGEVSMLRRLRMHPPLPFTRMGVQLFCHRRKRFRELQYGPIYGSDLWPSYTGRIRVADGIPDRTHRLRCLGNAVVPQVAQVVAERLLEIHDARCVNFFSEKE